MQACMLFYNNLIDTNRIFVKELHWCANNSSEHGIVQFQRRFGADIEELKGSQKSKKENASNKDGIYVYSSGCIQNPCIFCKKSNIRHHYFIIAGCDSNQI